MKKKWQKPHLIVLVRGKSEENVLGACKFTSLGGVAKPANVDADCLTNINQTACESGCSNLAAS